jgi:hypothetical protein
MCNFSFTSCKLQVGIIVLSYTYIVIICRLQHGFQLCKLHIATMNVDCNMVLFF